MCRLTSVGRAHSLCTTRVFLRESKWMPVCTSPPVHTSPHQYASQSPANAPESEISVSSVSTRKQCLSSVYGWWPNLWAHRFASSGSQGSLFIILRSNKARFFEEGLRRRTHPECIPHRVKPLGHLRSRPWAQTMQPIACSRVQATRRIRPFEQVQVLYYRLQAAQKCISANRFYEPLLLPLKPA